MRGNRWDEFSGDRGYREDEDTYVYDQGCVNCGNPYCPMRLPETNEADDRYRKVMKMREEDAEIRNGIPVWCIYWQKKQKKYRGRKRS